MAPALPLALQIVAWLLIYAGVRAVVAMLTPGGGGFQLDLTVLAIWAGIQLLRLRSGWRQAVMVVLWLCILGGVVGVFGLLFRGWATPALGALYLCLALIAVSYWQYRVLARPEVKALYSAADGARELEAARIPAGSIRCRYCQTLVPEAATVCPKCDADPRGYRDPEEA